MSVWDLVDADGICWLWGGANTGGPDPYGRIGRRMVHRLVWEALVGPIPEDYHIDHLCRVRLCCNPDHLRPVPPGQNVLAGYGPSALNARKTACPQGHPYDGVDRNGRRICVQCYRKMKRDAKRRERAATRI